METPVSVEKLGQEQDVPPYAASCNEGAGQVDKSSWEYLRYYFTSWEGWIGNYVSLLTKLPLLFHGCWLTENLGLPLLGNTQHLAT
jgi:hypothetical protein